MAQRIERTGLFLLWSTLLLLCSRTHHRVCAFPLRWEKDRVRPLRVASATSHDPKHALCGRNVRRPEEEEDPLVTGTTGHEQDVDDPKRRHTLQEMVRRVAAATTTTSAVAASCCGSIVGTGVSRPQAAYGLAPIVAPDRAASALFDVARNPRMDAAFAAGMATSMKEYEAEAARKKQALFAHFFSLLPPTTAGKKAGRAPPPTIVEIGMGYFPNAQYYRQNHVTRCDIIGIDPNDQMARYATANAKKAKLLGTNTLRIIHGVSEALPLATSSVDAVVCTLTLCSVVDPVQSIAEIKRVLKPGGHFLFWEHVLSETNETLKKEQMALTPRQVRINEGCHLNRQTGHTIQEAGFQSLAIEYFELQNSYYLNPTSCGIATA